MIELLVVRHGETQGYHDDVGLTTRGEQQARSKGEELAPALAGRQVIVVHAPTARARATAELMRATLLERADPPAQVDPPLVDRRFDSPLFLFEDRATDSTRVAARRILLREQGHPGPVPAWAVDFDRFDGDIGESTFSGDPSTGG